MIDNLDFSSQDIVLTTLDTLPGYDIDEHIGLVSGNAVNMENPVKGFIKKFKSMFGGEDKELSDKIKATRDAALQAMIDNAKNRGANSVISIRFENAITTSSFIEVYVYGTAVKSTKF